MDVITALDVKWKWKKTTRRNAELDVRSDIVREMENTVNLALHRMGEGHTSMVMWSREGLRGGQILLFRLKREIPMAMLRWERN